MYRTVYSFLQNTNADRFRAVCAIIRKNNKTVKIILQPHIKNVHQSIYELTAAIKGIRKL